VEAGLQAPTNLAELADCASESRVVADLLGLALSPEYAEIRFRVSRRVADSGSSGQHRI
jgi:hypothetical protein